MPSITQAFVLGAGLGTRLRPLTDNLPKPLIPIFQKPLITFALDHLIDLGVKSFIINTHHRAAAFQELFAEESYGGHPVRLVHEPEILGTGGGIKNVEPLLHEEFFITYSGDILTDIDLKPLLDEHLRAGNDATLALRETHLGKDVVLDGNRVVDMTNRYGREGRYDFAGICVWTRAIFARIPPAQNLSYIPILAEWIGQGGKIGGVVLQDGLWFNIGSRTEYLEVHRTILKKEWEPRYVKTAGWSAPIAASADVDPTAQLSGCSVVGADCEVGAGAILDDTIVWPGVQIASQSELTGCIVRSHQKVAGTYRNIDI
ncbi:MAG: mannose-phosphate guanylyltransferase [Verrucomicrobiota bacterium]|jgi:NDP-sugar pyrophosphorylase family protein